MNPIITPFPTQDAPDRQFKHYRIKFVDGTTRDYPVAWDSDEQSNVRDQAIWFTFEHLFNGTMPETPQASRIVAVWMGPRGSQPGPDNIIEEN